MVKPPANLYYGNIILDQDIFRINVESNRRAPGSYTSRHYICPGCGIRYRLAAFDDEASNFVYPLDELGNHHQHLLLVDNHGFENNETIAIQNEHDVYQHIDNCKPGLADGIHHVTSDSDERLLNLVETFSRFSKSDTGFGEGGGQAGGIWRGECEAYLLIDDSMPVSYVATTSRSVIERESDGSFRLFEHDVQSAFREMDENNPDWQLKYYKELWMISDLFTMFDYRRRGYSRKLSEHVISEKGMNRADLPVTIPLTEGSLSLFRKLSTANLLGLMPEGTMSQRVSKGDASILLKKF